MPATLWRGLATVLGLVVVVTSGVLFVVDSAGCVVLGSHAPVVSCLVVRVVALSRRGLAVVGWVCRC